MSKIDLDNEVTAEVARLFPHAKVKTVYSGSEWTFEVADLIFKIKEDRYFRTTTYKLTVEGFPSVSGTTIRRVLAKVVDLPAACRTHAARLNRLAAQVEAVLPKADPMDALLAEAQAMLGETP
jgi:hypothetical protein